MEIINPMIVIGKPIYLFESTYNRPPNADMITPTKTANMKIIV